MKLIVVADGYVNTKGTTVSFIEETFKEIGIPTDDIEYVDSYPYEYTTAPNLKDKKDAEAWATWNADLKEYILKEQPDQIIAFGNNAIYALGLVTSPKGVNKLRGKPMEAYGVNTLCTISPNLVLREPMHQTDFNADLSVVVNGVRQINMHIIDITCVEDIRTMFAECKITKTVAYDWEATDKEPAKKTTIPVTCAFATDRLIDGNEVVYFLQLYDKLKPCFAPAEMAEIKAALTEFFVEAGNEFDMIGHNIGYDDWVTEEYIEQRIFGSSYDTMLEKWSYNNIRPHGLKETVARYLGIPEYDKGITDGVKEVKARRGKNLVHEDDFYVLEWLGIEPITSTRSYKNGTTKTTYKWPEEEVDTGFATYAMLDRETLREYNCRDAVVTLWLHKYFWPKIVEEGLEESCSFRHVIAKELLRAEQRGLPLNVKTNREFKDELEKQEKICFDNLVASFAHVTNDPTVQLAIPDPHEFNPNSYPQVAAILFGELAAVPVINRKALYRDIDREEADKIADKVEELVYADYVDVKDFLRKGEFAYDLAEEYLDEEYRKLTKDYNTELKFSEKFLGLGGLGYNPVSYSLKTGLPGAGKVSLLMMQHQQETDFISLLLMYRKITKLRTTFIEKLYRTRDHNDVARTHYNVVGTDSARISSSGNYNGQNFPKYIRGQLTARPGYWILSCDLKAVEVRVLAAYCQDPGLLEAIYAEDTHKAVASIIFGVPVDKVTDDQRKAGKAQPAYAKVLTTQGWSTMGEVTVGDKVIDCNGEQTTVLGKYPQGVRPVYRVFFHDGSSVDADLDHLWVTDMWRGTGRHLDKVVSTRDMLEYGVKRWECKSRPNESRFKIKRPAPVDFEKKWHLLDPYAMGVMLGDGNIESLTFCYGANDAEMFDLVAKVVTPRFDLRVKDTTRKGTVVAKIYTDGDHILSDWFEKCGLSKATGAQKHIPECYMYSTIEDRLAILQGLMDTDGSVSSRQGQCEFSNKSLKLVEHVRELVLSLGGSTGKISGYESSYKDVNGDKVHCGTHYRLSSIALPTDLCPFRLTRKADVFRAFRKNAPKGKFIHDIQFVGYAPTYCISVDSPTKTYLTDDYTVTHNTTVFLTLYGGGAEKLGKFLGVTVSRAQQIINDFRARFPLLDEFIKKQHENAKKAPNFVYTPWGTRRSVRNILSDDREVSAKFERISVNCVDEETEILSERGWIQHTDLVVGDKVLTKNIETGVLEWQPVLEKFVYPDYEGDVYHMNHKSFSAVCTPNHRWVVFNKHSKKDEFRATEDLSIWGDYRIHRTGAYEQNPEVTVWTDDEVRLLGWLLTDGGYKDRCRTISLYQSKPCNIQPITDLLDRMGVFYRHTIRDTSSNPLANYTDMHVWSICNEYCDRVRKYAPKRGLTPELVLSLTTQQREMLLETMLLGDGTHDKKASPHDQGKRSCVFKNEDAASNFQFLLTLLGYSSNKFFTKYQTAKKNGSLGFWKVNIHRRDKTQVVGSQIEVRNEKRLMWCPSVKNGSFMARRRGQVYCTGNSPIQGGAGELCLYYEAEFMLAVRDKGWADFYSDDGLINFVITVHDEITFEIHESLIWRENERTIIDAKGKEVVVYDIVGPAWELFKEATSKTVPYPPLDTVRFDFDAELTRHWAGEPNLKKALESSSNPEEKFMWELLKSGVQLTIPDKELRDEIKDEFAEFVAPEEE